MPIRYSNDIRFLNNILQQDWSDNARMQALKEEYETLLVIVETEFIAALATGNWEGFDEFISSLKSSPQFPLTAGEHLLQELK